MSPWWLLLLIPASLAATAFWCLLMMGSEKLEHDACCEYEGQEPE